MNLPEYNPSDKIWIQIETKLNDEILQKSIETMPIYEPKEIVWQQIEQQLTSKIINFKPWRWAGVAAVLAIFISFYLLYNFDNQQISYSEEKIDQSVLINLSNDSDEQYKQIIAFCETENDICKNPEFKVLRTELDDLQNASIQLRNAMGQYNTEPQLMAQLTDVEQQKTLIIRKISAKI